MITREANFFSSIPEKQTFFFQKLLVRNKLFLGIISESNFFGANSSAPPPPNKYQMAVALTTHPVFLYLMETSCFNDVLQFKQIGCGSVAWIIAMS